MIVQLVISVLSFSVFFLGLVLHVLSYCFIRVYGPVVVVVAVIISIVVVVGQRRSRRNHSIINPASSYVLFVRVVVLFLSHTCGVPIGRLFLLLFRYKQPIFSPRVLLLYSCFGNMMMMDQEENDNREELLLTVLGFFLINFDQRNMYLGWND